MKLHTKSFAITAFFVLTSLTLFSETSTDRLKKVIDLMNENLEQSYLKKDVATLMKYYNSEFTFFPEYNVPIFDKDQLAIFFESLFKLTTINKFKKDVFEILPVKKDYLLETGNFEMKYTVSPNIERIYQGHYMILWKKTGSEWKIVSEALGSNTYIDEAFVPWSAEKLLNVRNDVKPTVHSSVKKKLEDFDAIVIRAVKEGDAEARANGFTKDALLMANFDSIKVGIEQIRPKMLKTYSSSVSYSVEHSYQRIYDLGNFVFANGHYEGGWGDHNSGGRFSGNMSNLLKVTADGSLLMHRQLGNRDSTQIIFGN